MGEVWAMIGWLKRVQPSLRSVVVEAEPAGFAVLSNLNNRILEGMDPEQVRREFVGIDSVAGNPIRPEREPSQRAAGGHSQVGF